VSDPQRNFNVPTVPQPSTGADNLAACVMALKAGVESLGGMRGKPADRAVTFNDLIDFGILTKSAVQSPNGQIVFPGGDASGKFLPLTGGTVTGDLTTTSHAAIGTKKSIWKDYGAVIVRLSDRVFIGAAAAQQSGLQVNYPTSWLAQLQNLAYTEQFAQNLVISTTGTLAIVAATRSSDSPAAGLGVTGGNIALSGYAINDDTTLGSGLSPSAYAAYLETRHYAGVGGSSLCMELDIDNFGAVADIFPSGLQGPGYTIGIAFNCGGGCTGVTPASAAGYIGKNGAVFRKGFVFEDIALDPTVGAGGKGVALEMGLGASLRWLNTSNATLVEVFGAATPTGSGFNVNGGINTPHGIIGNRNSLWTDYGAHAARLSDRIFVGAASNVEGGDGSHASDSWMSQLQNLAYTGTFAQLHVLSTSGTLAVVCGARSSDGEPFFGGPSGATIGMSAYAFNDDTTAPLSSSSPNIWAAYLEARRSAGVNGGSNQCMELDIVNFGSVVDVYPTGFGTPGYTLGIAYNCGGGNSNVHQASAAIWIGNNGSSFRKGMVVGYNSLDGTIGQGGYGVAIELGGGMSIRWLGTSNEFIGELWGSSTGLIINGTLSVSGAVFAPTAAPATNNTQVATTAFVKSLGFVTGGPYLSTAGGTMTGTITSTTGTMLTGTSAGSFNPQIKLTNQAPDANAAYLLFQKGRAGGTTTLSGDGLGTVAFYGYGSGNAQANGPSIFAISTGAASATFVPADLVFNVTTASVGLEVMRLTSTGVLNINTHPALTYNAGGIVVYDSAGNQANILGGGQTYYRNTQHNFQTIGGAATLMTLASAGLSVTGAVVGSTTLNITGNAFIGGSLTLNSLQAVDGVAGSIRIYDGSGNIAQIIGSGQTYYRNTTHNIQSINGAAQLATISASGIQSNGSLAAATGVSAGTGFSVRAGTAGPTRANVHNIDWAPGAQLWVDASNIGTFAFTSDYRTKRDIEPLPGMWEKVKSLRPVSFRHKATDDGLFVDDPTERWGFVAHELQETLTETAASGHKDEPNVIQSPNLLLLLAVLAKGLQEAIGRIETLEGKVA
jgi:hypothetical protein